MERYIQTQKYAECKLIAMLNAKTYLTGEFIDPDSKEYEELVDFACARHGSVIGVDKVMKKLKLDYKPGPAIFNWIERHLPVEVCIHHPKLGYHCVCIVDAEYRSEDYKFKKYVYTTNFFDKGNMLWDEFSKLIVRNMPNLGLGHDAISYYMKGKKNG